MTVIPEMIRVDLLGAAIFRDFGGGLMAQRFFGVLKGWRLCRRPIQLKAPKSSYSDYLEKITLLRGTNTIIALEIAFPPALPLGAIWAYRGKFP